MVERKNFEKFFLRPFPCVLWSRNRTLPLQYRNINRRQIENNIYLHITTFPHLTGWSPWRECGGGVCWEPVWCWEQEDQHAHCLHYRPSLTEAGGEPWCWRGLDCGTCNWQHFYQLFPPPVRSEVTPFQCCSESSLVTCLSNLREHFGNISILGMLSAVRRGAYTETSLLAAVG